MRKAFEHFSVKDTVQWFESRGVKLKSETDKRMFPRSNSSQTIIDILQSEADSVGVQLKMNVHVLSLKREDTQWLLDLGKGAMSVDAVIIATGGSPKRQGLEWIEKLGHQIIEPRPSLFTFNMPKEPITQLMGVSMADVEVRIVGSKLSARGALMITHWGMSGPAILKLSAFGARELAEGNYSFSCSVNWLAGMKEHELREGLNALLADIVKRQVGNKNPFQIPARLWAYFLERANIAADKVWMELPKKDLNKLINILVNDTYEVSGKTTFKEEFVTAGGVSRDDIDPSSMMSKVCSGLYFAGEVIDIDGVTGGFNFQAAWTSGFIAGQLKGL